MSRITQMMLEATVFVAAAGAIGLGYNSLRSDGLDLGRNYFPHSRVAMSPPSTEQPKPAGPAAGVTSEPAPEGDPAGSEPGGPEGRKAADKLASLGLQGISLEDAYQYFQLRDSTILLVDARSDDAYREGHIPGAVQFYPYYPDKYIEDIRLFADIAQVVIVYCGGGDCEDSISAAFYLTTEMPDPIPAERVFVFEGGMTEWKEAGYPLVAGETPEGDLP